MSKPKIPFWASNETNVVEPPTAKKNEGAKPGLPEAAQYLNWPLNVIWKWLRGLQHQYGDIVVGSAAQVTSLDAQHEFTNDTTLAAFAAAVANRDRIVFLGNQTHTLTENLALTEDDLEFVCEAGAIIDLASTYTITLSGARNKGRLRVVNAPDAGIILSGLGTAIDFGAGVTASKFAISGGARATINGKPVPIILADSDATVVVPAGGAEYLITPSVARTKTLDGSNLGIGEYVKFTNLATVAGRNVILNGEDAARIWVVCPKNRGILTPNVNDPDAASKWQVDDPGWPIHARVHKSADQSNVTEATPTKVTFDTTLVDPAGMFSDANDRFVLPVAGQWEVEGAVYMEGVANAFLRALPYFNGAETAGGGYGHAEEGGTVGVIALFKGVVNCTVPGTDYVESYMRYAGDGTNVGDIAEVNDVFTTSKATWFSAKWIGP